MALPLFSVTLFVSAFLLFLVQPLMGKLLLPKLGGTPQVWNTCMVFFQTVLLAGYAYTHTSGTRLKLRSGLSLHLLLLLVALPLFFIIPTAAWWIIGWAPDPDLNPIATTLGMLFVSIGVPFFVVSTSAPLLQKWFVYTGDPAAKDPYFLYGASNLGSLLSLVLYPFLIEPFLPVMGQRYMLLVFYVILAVLIVACALRVWKSPVMEVQLAAAGMATAEGPAAPQTPAPETMASTAVKSGPAPARAVARKKGLKGHGPGAGAPASAEPEVVHRGLDEMTWLRRVRWVLLAAVPSSLMLGVTSYVSVDLSPFPLLWIIPLALYLLTFIIVFMPWWTGSTAGRSANIRDGVEFSPHVIFIYFLMPLAIVALTVLLVNPRSGFDPFWSTLILMVFFFFITLGCHGELARDRPTTHHLTEYYLLMSFGGMLGGVFNAIIAPQAFTGVWEFPIAIALAALARPRLVESGWLDELILNTSPSFQSWVRQQGDEVAESAGRPAPHSPWLFSYFMDVVLGVSVFVLAWILAWWFSDQQHLVTALKFFGGRGALGQYAHAAVLFGLPLVVSFFFYGRPLRFALAVAGVIFINYYLYNERFSGENVRYAGRSYFGVLRVLEDKERTSQGNVAEFTYLMHGSTYHGRNYISKKGSPDLTRLATTYYHRFGPMGVVMEQYNWLPGPQNTWWGDARMPATQVGAVMASLAVGNLPIANLVDLWSEPPYATIGLGTGTMASYARPYQHLTYYEIDEKIRNMSLPTDGSPAYFTYLQGAMRRGANLDVVMGDARLSMDRERPHTYIRPSFRKEGSAEVELTAAPVSEKDHAMYYAREGYYKAINVDAFSSDAIPVHLITKQAIQLYLSRLTPDGILCVHTSNRHLNLVKPVARIVVSLNKDAEATGGPEYRVMVGKDLDRRQEDGAPLGHFSSEYVMVFRADNKNFERWLEKCEAGQLPSMQTQVTWYNPIEKGEVTPAVWTDDYSNIVGVIRWPWSRH